MSDRLAIVPGKATVPVLFGSCLSSSSSTALCPDSLKEPDTPREQHHTQRTRASRQWFACEPLGEKGERKVRLVGRHEVPGPLHRRKREVVPVQTLAADCM